MNVEVIVLGKTDLRYEGSKLLGRIEMVSLKNIAEDCRGRSLEVESIFYRMPEMNHLASFDLMCLGSRHVAVRRLCEMDYQWS